MQRHVNAQRLIIARWLCKIFIGVLVKESILLVDRRDPTKGNIIPPQLLEEFRHAQLILQTARKPSVFQCLHGPFPFTAYCYGIRKDPDFGDFDLSTHIGGQSIAVRLGPVGLIFVNDGGLQLHVGQLGPLELDGSTLHPLQFSEVTARVHYKASLRDATHQYVSFENPDLFSCEQVAVRPYSNIRLPGNELQIFRPWDDLECAAMIARYAGLPFDAVFDEQSGTFGTTLLDKDGSPITPDDFAKQMERRKAGQ